LLQGKWTRRKILLSREWLDASDLPHPSVCGKSAQPVHHKSPGVEGAAAAFVNEVVVVVVVLLLLLPAGAAAAAAAAGGGSMAPRMRSVFHAEKAGHAKDWTV
jgi:hypothetical protein